jgi:hypothetical protein
LIGVTRTGEKANAVAPGLRLPAALRRYLQPRSRQLRGISGLFRFRFNVAK